MPEPASSPLQRWTKRSAHRRELGTFVGLLLLGGALWVHAGNGWVFSANGGGWEYPLYLIVLAAAQVLLGEGAFALSRRSLLTRHTTAHLSAA
jgi:putative oxidoreductase